MFQPALVTTVRTRSLDLVTVRDLNSRKPGGSSLWKRTVGVAQRAHSIPSIPTSRSAIFIASNTHYHPPDPGAALVPAEHRLEIVAERSRRRWQLRRVVVRGSSEVKAALPGRRALPVVVVLPGFLVEVNLLWLPSHGGTPLKAECREWRGLVWSSE